MSKTSAYLQLSHIEQWVCLDIEINPETDDFISGAIYYQYKGQKPALQTLVKETAFLNALSGLAKSGVTCIGHNLRRHDLKWISSRNQQIPEFNRCIDTLELYPIVYPSAQSHALEKNYKNPRTDDPMLRKGKPHPNHPALDCETTMELLVDILGEFV